MAGVAAPGKAADAPGATTPTAAAIVTLRTASHPWMLRWRMKNTSLSLGRGFPRGTLIEVLEDKVVRSAEAKFNELLARMT
jgi:hypothetical protein